MKTQDFPLHLFRANATPCERQKDAKHDHFANCTAVSSGGSGDTYFTEELVVLAPDVIILLGSEAAKADELQAQVEIPVVAIYARDFMDKQLQNELPPGA